GYHDWLSGRLQRIHQKRRTVPHQAARQPIVITVPHAFSDTILTRNMRVSDRERPRRAIARLHRVVLDSLHDVVALIGRDPVMSLVAQSKCQALTLKGTIRTSERLQRAGSGVPNLLMRLNAVLLAEGVRHHARQQAHGVVRLLLRNSRNSNPRVRMRHNHRSAVLTPT